MNNPNPSRRNFLKTTTALTFGFSFLGNACNTVSAQETMEEGLMMIGPKKGYTPQIGALVSMLNYNRETIVRSVKDLTREQIDHLFDPHANTIASLVMHLGATEKFYQINTFEGRQDFNEEEKKIWEPAMELGDLGREKIKGKDISYYLDLIAGVRAKTLEELKKKDDKWLLAKDPEWSKPDKPINTYWKWFHVCEHESNHRGQISFLKSRLPGAKWSGKE